PRRTGLPFKLAYTKYTSVANEGWKGAEQTTPGGELPPGACVVAVGQERGLLPFGLGLGGLHGAAVSLGLGFGDGLAGEDLVESLGDVVRLADGVGGGVVVDAAPVGEHAVGVDDVHRRSVLGAVGTGDVAGGVKDDRVLDLPVLAGLLVALLGAGLVVVGG